MESIRLNHDYKVLNFVYVRLLDWSKLACMLCSRGFKDVETLQKHRSLSSLHYDNLNKLRAKYGLPTMSVPNSTSVSDKKSLSLMQIGAHTANEYSNNVAMKQSTQYRDRAKERREKYGIPSPPRMVPTKSPVKQPTPEPYTAPVAVTTPINLQSHGNFVLLYYLKSYSVTGQ